MAELIKDIHKIVLPFESPLNHVNVYLVAGTELTLIDAGVNSNEAWGELESQIRSLGYKVTDIKNIVITHHHPDHIGLLDYFSQDVKVFGHSYNKDWVNNHKNSQTHFNTFINRHIDAYGIPERFREHLMKKEIKSPVSTRRIDNFLMEGQYLSFLPDFKVLETPGHCSTHICLYRKTDGILVGGDLLINNIFLNTFMEPPIAGRNERPKLLLEYNKSLLKVKDLHANVIYPGHGEEIKEIDLLIDLQFKKQNKRKKRVMRLLKERPYTIYELCTKLFPGLYEIQLALALSETIGIMDLLEEEKHVVINKSGKIWVCNLNPIPACF
ncbi:MBL fold metallo-hydrolase [Priestia megaterium]|uniref:MBL fold metallo-hydrolase n=1 Tax=Priestia megaterium TaxID=1404 RepID=UPI0030C9FF94